MRSAGIVICLVVFLGTARPADAQLRSSEATQTQSRLYRTQAAGFLLNTLFNPEHFNMSHSFEMSVGSSGFGTNSLAMYTNTLAWDFGSQLAASADVSLAYSPFSNGFGNSPNGLNRGQVFLRNAQVTYRPTENMRFNLSYHRSPYGYYAYPYGYGRRF